MRGRRPAARRLAGVLALFAAGCTTTGYLGGRLSGPGGLRAPVEFQWTAGWSGDRGTIQATLPSGETFSGRFIQVTRTHPAEELLPAVQVPGFDGAWPEWGPGGGDAWVSALNLDQFRREYADRIVATLLGNKGNAMRCRFRPFDPPKGFRGGGVGECQISYGNGTVAVQF